MKMIALVLITGLLATIFAAPQRPIIKILSQDNILETDGSYRYRYESADGTRAQQDGQEKQISPIESGQAAQGAFSFISTDGITYTVTYTADERGFIASGPHIPTPPPIPEAILRALAYNAAHPEEDNLK